MSDASHSISVATNEISQLGHNQTGSRKILGDSSKNQSNSMGNYHGSSIGYSVHPRAMKMHVQHDPLPPHAKLSKQQSRSQLKVSDTSSHLNKGKKSKQSLTSESLSTASPALTRSLSRNISSTTTLKTNIESHGEVSRQLSKSHSSSTINKNKEEVEKLKSKQTSNISHSASSQSIQSQTLPLSTPYHYKAPADHYPYQQHQQQYSNDHVYEQQYVDYSSRSHNSYLPNTQSSIVRLQHRPQQRSQSFSTIDNSNNNNNNNSINNSIPRHGPVVSRMNTMPPQQMLRHHNHHSSWPIIRVNNQANFIPNQSNYSIQQHPTLLRSNYVTNGSFYQSSISPSSPVTSSPSVSQMIIVPSNYQLQAYGNGSQCLL
jgi:hypothetical protein